MNIFYLSNDVIKSASAMTDKHIVKMVLETAQILSTVHQVHSINLIDGLYKPTHKNHPSVKWAMSNKENYKWLFRFFKAMSDEYTNRYGKQHKSFVSLSDILINPPSSLPEGRFYEPPQAMPFEYKGLSSIEAYRLYYESEKLKTDKDKKRYYGVFNSVVITPR